jgi:ribosome-binding factor A
MRNTPELTFIADDSIEHGDRISKILGGMNLSEPEREAEAEDGIEQQN